jgi:hypothetical protein
MSIQPRATSLRGHRFWLLLLLCLVPFIEAQAAETFTATASVKKADGVSATAPLTVVLDRFATDAERDALLAAIKKGGTASARDVLSKRADIGSVQLGSSRVPIKYAYARSTGGGRLITVVTGSPIAFVGSGLPGAAPKQGFDLGLVLLDVAASGKGGGELVPAAKIKLNDQDAVVTEDYSGEVIQLSSVVRK